MKLFGSKTEALFDWWSLGHVILYYVLSKFFLLEFSFEWAILLLILIGYLWELVERMLENFVHTKHFFHEKEGWMNRYVGDILADVTGFLLAWYL